jgi:hypothetical protein
MRWTNFEQNYCAELFIYTLRDLQFVLKYISLFKKTHPFLLHREAPYRGYKSDLPDHALD